MAIDQTRVNAIVFVNALRYIIENILNIKKTLYTNVGFGSGAPLKLDHANHYFVIKN